MKIIVYRNETKKWIDSIETSAEASMLSIANLAADKDAMSFLYECKFHENGFDPLDCTRSLNFIEQLNQSFTYLVSFRSAEYLFSKHSEVHSLILNLGTSKGFDIEEDEGDTVTAEVFASVNPNNNSKLLRDIFRVATAKTKFKYVFFMAPSHSFSEKTFEHRGVEVNVVSLGTKKGTF